MKNFKSGGDYRGEKKSFGGGGFKGRDDRGGSRGSFGGGGRGFGGGGVTMHKAVCAQCGKTCEVPFRPTGDKPVYCNDCFGKERHDGGRDAGRGDRGNAFPKSFDRADRPAPRNEVSYNIPPRANTSDRTPDRGIEDLKKQFEMLHIKLDTLIGFMQVNARQDTKASPVAKAPAPVVSKPTVAVKVAPVATKPAPAKTKAATPKAKPAVAKKAVTKTAAKKVVAKKK